MKVVKEASDAYWCRPPQWAIIGKGSGHVHAVFADKHLAEVFCQYIDDYRTGDCGYEVFKIEGSIDQ